MSASQLSKNRTIKQFGAIQSVLRIRRAEIIISTYRAHSLHREFNILLWNMNYLHNKTFRGCWKLCSWRRIFVFISFKIRTNWNLIQWWNDQWDLGNILNHCIYNEKPNNKNIFIYIYCIISSITYTTYLVFQVVLRFLWISSPIRKRIISSKNLGTLSPRLRAN